MTGRMSELRLEYDRRGRAIFEIELTHDGLRKHRVIRGDNGYVVQSKAAMQMAQWDDMWAKKSARDEQIQRINNYQQKQALNKQTALERTNEATEFLDLIRKTLQYTLERNDAIDWEGLKDWTHFPEPPPSKPNPPTKPYPISMPFAPDPKSPRYIPQLSFVDNLISSRKLHKQNEAQARYQQDYARWENERNAAIEADNQRREQHEQEIAKLEETHQQYISQWVKRKAEFIQKQKEHNEAIDRQKAIYLTGTAEGIMSYGDFVLASSKYPDCFPQQWELDFDATTKLMLVDYLLPAPGDVPTLLEVKYVATKDSFVEKYLSEPQLNKLYDDLLYQITLRTIHELFESDVIDAIHTIVFNGIVKSINKATGQEVSACVLSVQTNRNEFLEINLAHVEPRACFRQLKGIGSSKLHSITPVAPILQIDRNDRRFVPSYDVTEKLDAGYNLAAMDWEDFEHLIREIFEKEFSVNGGEVKVTQASRDGGVDAVAFDPDPIRGGKIVIQAKRYTHTVGVSAVRDLYGTVMNEGAIKGILVTTANYGPDAYEFAKNKPITLLSGSHLLHLLERHGHKARIDLQEARRIATERDRNQ